MLSWELVRRWGADGLCYTGLRNGGRPLVAPNGGSCIAYVRAAGTALALGAPAGPSESALAIIEEFIQACRRWRLRPAWCGVPWWVAELLATSGFRTVPVGDEAVVDPNAADLRGRRWRETRAALNRARRQGVSFAWAPFPMRTPALRRQLDEVSRAWLSRKALPELGLSFGSMAGIDDPWVRLGIARSGEGQVLGLVTWVPVPAQQGWALELLRRRPQAPAGLSDFLVASSLLTFQAEGCRHASLGGTPLASVAVGQPKAARWLLCALSGCVRPLYDCEGLRHFKKKFNPSWRPLYLAYQGWGGLPRTLLAIQRSCGPALTPATLARPPVALARALLRS